MNKYVLFRVNQGFYNFGEGHESSQEGNVIPWLDTSLAWRGILGAAL